VTGIVKQIAALFGATLRAQAKDVRGNAAIEVAFTCTALLMFLFGIIEVGFAMWLQSALDFSVAEAARCASVNSTLCGTTSQIQSYAANRSGAGFNSSIFSVSTPSCGNQVSASYPLILTIPAITFSVTLDAQACFPS
jgi:Flp pilus assembly protein TadG